MTVGASEEHTTEQLEDRVAELRRLVADADDALQLMRPSSPTASGGNEKLMELEGQVAAFEQEMKRIQQK
eukprot:COSAG02_NODE_23161_length_728_cov_0.977742_1_plen_69_part_01